MLHKYLIIKSDGSDYMKDEAGKIKTYDTEADARIARGFYELEDVVIVKVVQEYGKEED